MIKKSVLILTLSTFLLIGCNKTADTSEEKQKNNTETKETFISVAQQPKSPLTFKDKNIYSTKFLSLGSYIFFPDKEDNNYLSVITDNLTNNYIDSNSIVDTFNYSIESTATINNEIYFTNISDNNALYKLDYLKKSISKVSDGSFYNILATNKYIFFINRNNNSRLSFYDPEINQQKSISLDKCGKYLVNGEFILYENLSDGASLYSIKLDGSERTKITTDPVDSFVPYNNNILYISARDNNLYNYNTTLNQSNKIHTLNGTDLKNYDNNFFYIDLSNSNHLHSLELDEAITKAWTTELTSDMVNEYFPISNGIFYKKPLDINKSYFLPYK